MWAKACDYLDRLKEFAELPGEIGEHVTEMISIVHDALCVDDEEVIASFVADAPLMLRRLKRRQKREELKQAS